MPYGYGVFLKITVKKENMLNGFGYTAIKEFVAFIREKGIYLKNEKARENLRLKIIKSIPQRRMLENLICDFLSDKRSERYGEWQWPRWGINYGLLLELDKNKLYKIAHKAGYLTVTKRMGRIEMTRRLAQLLSAAGIYLPQELAKWMNDKASKLFEDRIVTLIQKFNDERYEDLFLYKYPNVEPQLTRASEEIDVWAEREVKGEKRVLLVE
jgi:hypothetical protein